LINADNYLLILFEQRLLTSLLVEVL
jgi:hypothetical protein